MVKHLSTRIEHYCGCCGEAWAKCVCKEGPTESFTECVARRDNKLCVHNIPDYIYNKDNWLFI